MRNLRVLILLSAVLVLSGVVFISTTAFAISSTKGSVVLVCHENGGSTQVKGEPGPDVCGIDNGTPCGLAIATLLNLRCELENSFAVTTANNAAMFVFICRGQPAESC